jgi:hypothetical protein
MHGFHRLLTSTLSALALAAAGCGATVDDAAQNGVNVDVTPDEAVVAPGSTVAFSSTVTGTASVDVAWSVDEGTTGGSVTSSGLYTAGSSEGVFHVVATSVADPTRSARATVSVGTAVPPPPTNFVPSNLLTRWDPGIPGGIPSNGPIHTTINAATYGNGTTDATSAINSAIQAAGNTAASTGTQQVVYLPPGTYRTSGIIQMNRSDVVLRGAGPGQTRIVTTASGPQLRLGRVWPTYPQSRAYDVVGSALKGTSAFTLSNADAASIQVGDVLQIDQQDRLQRNGGYIWFWDGRYQKRGPTSDYGSQGPLTGQAPDFAAGYSSPTSIGGPWRSVGQQVEIAGKTAGSSTTTFTIRGVFHIDFEAARYPQVFHTASRWTSARNMPGTHRAGIEDLYLSGGNQGTIHGWNVAYCWIKNVEIDGDAANGYGGAQGPAIELAHAYRVVIRDSYVHHDRNMRNNSGSYGIFLTSSSSDCLVENNIAMWMCKPIMLDTSGGGNVIAYNYADQAIIVNTNWQENAIDGCHQTFSHSDLFEGNWAPNLGSDSTHGNAGWLTWFRNYASGRNSFATPGAGLPTGNLRAAGADGYSGVHTFIANVLDAAWGAASYEWTAASHSGSPPIFRLGDNSNGGSGGVWDDGTAAANAYRHGNWDAATRGVVWHDGNAERDVPVSLYLTSKPPFFGDLPWPWVNPLGATPAERVGTLPAKARFDAM